ncbi:MAG: hypothetical protein CMJ76_02415 [Planctomycetaceae bacterium]|nr:hypothetical protein [Planctomycetaceae bacterium]
MTSPLKIAFIGVDNPHGAGWRDLLANLKTEFQLSALVPHFDGSIASLEEKYSDLPRYETVTELIANAQFDAAIVAVSNRYSADVIEELAAAGKHILAEKPVAGRTVDAERIRQAVDSAGIAFQTGYMWRYDDCANRLKRMIAEGRFGKLISVEAVYATSDVNRRGPAHYLFDVNESYAGFFSWLACHHIDLVQYITGQAVKAVTSRVGNFTETSVAVEDGGTAILDLDSGAIATLIGGYWMPRWSGEVRWTIRGSKRWVYWDPSKPDTGGSLEIHGPQPQWYAMEETYDAPVDSTPGYGGGPGVELLEDWLAMIRGDVETCRNTTESMLTTVRVVDTILQASEEGRRIDL